MTADAGTIPEGVTPDGTVSVPETGRLGLSPEHVAMNLGFIVLVCAIVWGVLSRYVTESPATWVEEVSSIAFAWVVFVGAAEAHRRSKHVSVDLLTSFLPPTLRSVLGVATSLFVATYCFYVAWLGGQQTIASNAASTSMLHIPLSVPYAGLTIGFLLMGVRNAWRFTQKLRSES